MRKQSNWKANKSFQKTRDIEGNCRASEYDGYINGKKAKSKVDTR